MIGCAYMLACRGFLFDMKKTRNLMLAIISVFLASCSHVYGPAPTITLIVPNLFKGEIFIIENAKTGQDWRNGSIVIHKTGIASVKDLRGLAETAPNKFNARYVNGRRLKNSIIRSGPEGSLWPVCYIENELLYFASGTFHEKTVYDNEKFGGKWKEIIDRIKGEAGQ